jgi:hypothetical protein
MNDSVISSRIDPAIKEQASHLLERGQTAQFKKDLKRIARSGR